MNQVMSVDEYRAQLPYDEAAFQADVVRLAKLAGWHVFHVADSRKEVNRQGARILVGDPLAKGYPDLTLVKGRRFLIRELKTNHGRLTAAQKEWLTVLQAAGIDAAVWRPKDRPVIEQTLAGDNVTRAQARR